MTWQRLRYSTAALAAFLASGVAWAQQPSLVEVARREAERRKKVSSSRVYTNQDLKGGPRLTTAATPVQTPGANGEPAPASAPAAVQPPGDDPAPAREERPRDEDSWRERITDLRDELNRNRLFAEALQSRINGLWADLAARDDPAQRALIEERRSEAMTELERVNSEIASGETAIADLEEEARRAGVRPAWLR